MYQVTSQHYGIFTAGPKDLVSGCGIRQEYTENGEIIMNTSVTEQNMPTDKPDTDLPQRSRLATVKHVMKMDMILFIGIMFLTLLGVGITDYKGESAHTYWRYMVILMAITTSLWGVWRAWWLGLAKIGKLLYQQVVLWGTALVALRVIYLLLDTGRLNFETTGLLILLILGFTTFIDGMLVSWKLYVVGALLLFTLLMATHVEQYLWMIIIAAVVMMALVIIFVVWKLRSFSKE